MWSLIVRLEETCFLNLYKWSHKFIPVNVYVLSITGEARIRVQISAVHSVEDIDRCVEAFIQIGKEKGVIQ